jgi:hypothetical protein
VPQAAPGSQFFTLAAAVDRLVQEKNADARFFLLAKDCGSVYNESLSTL